jgi:trans-2,3-dihydro-3-hydroxyanthranilate isomerase
MRRFPIVTLDVFTSRALEGNQLAVFTDTGGLSVAEMQALARDMRLAETTFIIPRDAALERERGVAVRIFTIAEEVPFAGHPTLGTAFVIANSRGIDEVTLDLKVGPIAVRFAERNGGRFGEMTQNDPVFGVRHRSADVAAAAGLAPEAIDTSLPIETVSTGFPFAIIPLRSLEALTGLNLDVRRAEAYLGGGDARLFYFVTRATGSPDTRLRARMIFYAGEDPATGSAAGCAAAWMVRHGVAKPGEQVTIEQGIETRRPSRIFVRRSGRIAHPRRARRRPLRRSAARRGGDPVGERSAAPLSPDTATADSDARRRASRVGGSRCNRSRRRRSRTAA